MSCTLNIGSKVLALLIGYGETAIAQRSVWWIVKSTMTISGLTSLLEPKKSYVARRTVL